MNDTLRKGHVLIADDDPLIRRLLARIVRREGMVADTAIDGSVAIQKLKSNDYDALLLDLMMPRVSGFKVVEFLGELPPEERPIVLVVTAYGDDEWQELDPDVVTGVVRKPFEIAELGRIVNLCIPRPGEDVEQHWSSVSSLRLLKRRT